MDKLKAFLEKYRKTNVDGDKIDASKGAVDLTKGLGEDKKVVVELVPDGKGGYRVDLTGISEEGIVRVPHLGKDGKPTGEFDVLVVDKKGKIIDGMITEGSSIGVETKEELRKAIFEKEIKGLDPKSPDYNDKIEAAKSNAQQAVGLPLEGREMDPGRAVIMGDKTEVQTTTFIIPKDRSQVENSVNDDRPLERQNERNDNSKNIVVSDRIIQDQNVVPVERVAAAAKLETYPQADRVAEAGANNVSAAIVESGASAARTAPTEDRAQDSASRAQDVETVSHSSNVAKESNVTGSSAADTVVRDVDSSGSRESNSSRENKPPAEDTSRAGNSVSQQSQARTERAEESAPARDSQTVVRAPDQPAPDSVQAPKPDAHALQNALVNQRESAGSVVQFSGPDVASVPTRAGKEKDGKGNKARMV